MKHSIENKIILVTGASRGIGYATALKLAEYGAQLILASRNLSDLEDIREKIQAFGKTPSIIQTNVTEKKDLENLFSIINKEYGKLDGAFNNSGILENPNHLHDIQEEEFWDLVKTNIYGTWMCMKNEINLMLKRKSGSIVNCSSINGLKGNPKHPIYSATKHAIIG